MKKIELVIEAHKLGDVQHALTAIGVSGATVRLGPSSETRLEIVVSAERAADVIRAFAGPSWRRLIGDAKMFVYEVAEPLRPRDIEPRENPTVPRL